MHAMNPSYLTCFVCRWSWEIRKPCGIRNNGELLQPSFLGLWCSYTLVVGQLLLQVRNPVSVRLNTDELVGFSKSQIKLKFRGICKSCFHHHQSNSCGRIWSWSRVVFEMMQPQGQFRSVDWNWSPQHCCSHACWNWNGAGMISPNMTCARLVAIALAHGLAICFLAGATGAISGGHLNPAVTLAFVVAGKETLIRAGLYVGAQVIIPTRPSQCNLIWTGVLVNHRSFNQTRTGSHMGNLMHFQWMDFLSSWLMM